MNVQGGGQEGQQGSCLAVHHVLKEEAIPSRGEQQ